VKGLETGSFAERDVYCLVICGLLWSSFGLALIFLWSWVDPVRAIRMLGLGRQGGFAGFVDLCNQRLTAKYRGVKDLLVLVCFTAPHRRDFHGGILSS